MKKRKQKEWRETEWESMLLFVNIFLLYYTSIELCALVVYLKCIEKARKHKQASKYNGSNMNDEDDDDGGADGCWFLYRFVSFACNYNILL